MGLLHECKPILAQRERRDLLRFVKEEIYLMKETLVADPETEQLPVLTAEQVVDSLIAKHPENTYVRPTPKRADIKWTADQKRVLGL